MENHAAMAVESFAASDRIESLFLPYVFILSAKYRTTVFVRAETVRQFSELGRNA